MEIQFYKKRLTLQIKNAGLNVSGTFKTFFTIIQFDPRHPDKIKLAAEVKLESISTGKELRDKHLKGDEYFDVLHFPVIKFVASAAQALSKEGSYILTGNLTIKKVTQVVSVPFTLSKQGKSG